MYDWLLFVQVTLIRAVYCKFFLDLNELLIIAVKTDCRLFSSPPTLQALHLAIHIVFQMRMNVRANPVSMPTPAGTWLAATIVTALLAGLATTVI